MKIAEAKENYNKLLKRHDKAEEYFARVDISQQEKESFLGAFEEILKGLNYYLQKIPIYTQKEIVGGFDYGE